MLQTAAVSSLVVIDQPSPSAVELPTVQALDQLWEDVSSKPLWAAPNFWRYLKLRRRMRTRFVKAEQLHVRAHQGQINDCASCTNNCCRSKHSTVSLRLKDIATLIDIGRTDLISPIKPEFSAAETQARPALSRTLRSRAWRDFPALKQVDDACAALSSDGRCTIFPHWPLSCARFPYALRVDEGEVYYSPRCDSFWVYQQGHPNVEAMTVAAAATYNERIKDLVLLEYAPKKLEALGLLTHLRPAGSTKLHKSRRP